MWLELLKSDLRYIGSEKPSSAHEMKNRVPEAVLVRSNARGIAEVIRAHEDEVPVATAGKGRALQMMKLAETVKTL